MEKLLVKSSFALLLACFYLTLPVNGQFDINSLLLQRLGVQTPNTQSIFQILGLPNLQLPGQCPGRYRVDCPRYCRNIGRPFYCENRRTLACQTCTLTQLLDRNGRCVPFGNCVFDNAITNAQRRRQRLATASTTRRAPPTPATTTTPPTTAPTTTTLPPPSLTVDVLPGDPDFTESSQRRTVNVDSERTAVCQSPFVFSNCVRCNRTCYNFLTNSNCFVGNCYAGCTCPENEVRHGNSCIDQNLCITEEYLPDGIELPTVERSSATNPPVTSTNAPATPIEVDVDVDVDDDVNVTSCQPPFVLSDCVRCDLTCRNFLTNRKCFSGNCTVGCSCPENQLRRGNTCYDQNICLMTGNIPDELVSTTEASTTPPTSAVTTTTTTTTTTASTTASTTQATASPPSSTTPTTTVSTNFVSRFGNNQNCRRPFLYSRCNCQRTCENRFRNLRCSLFSCRSGCYCPFNTYRLGNACVPLNECPQPDVGNSPCSTPCPRFYTCRRRPGSNFFQCMRNYWWLG